MGAPILDVRLLIPIVDHLLILWPVVTFTEAFADEQAMIKTRRKRKRITNLPSLGTAAPPVDVTISVPRILIGYYEKCPNVCETISSLYFAAFKFK